MNVSPCWRLGSLGPFKEALDGEGWGGSPMAPVDFKKWPCHYFCNFHVDSKKVSYRMSN